MSEQFVSSFVWRNPTRIVYGIGKLDNLADEVRGIAGDGANVFLVTGRSFLRERGILQSVLDDLADFSVTLHDRANPFPSPDDADAAAKQCRESGANVVVAIGGGSALDLAKAAAVLATQAGTSRDYMGGGVSFENSGLPFIAVPTTSGSSSEVTSGSALWDWDAKNHFGLSSQMMFPEVAIVDPKLAMTMDQNLAANTGMDAFTSAFESYWNVNAEPISDALALEVIRIYSQNLVRSAIQGDMESRAACAICRVNVRRRVQQQPSERLSWNRQPADTILERGARSGSRNISLASAALERPRDGPQDARAAVRIWRRRHRIRMR